MQSTVLTATKQYLATILAISSITISLVNQTKKFHIKRLGKPSKLEREHMCPTINEKTRIILSCQFPIATILLTPFCGLVYCCDASRITFT